MVFIPEFVFGGREMKKRIIAGVIAICMAFGSAAMLPENTFIDSTDISASAFGTETSGKCGENVNWELKNGVLTISGTGPMYPVDSDDYMNFYYRDDITSVVIKSGVTNIGVGLFEKCENLTSIDIPNSVTSIGDGAFVDCSNLTSADIPNGVTSIGDRAFRDCVSLTSVTIPSSVTFIGGYAFENTKWLENKQKEDPLVIINGILVDGTKCTGDIKIPDSVKDICAGAFHHNKVFTSVVIPKGIKNIRYDTFYYCTQLKCVTMPEGLLSIGKDAFYCCTRLESAAIPSTVTSIGEAAFNSCGSVKNLVIPSGVTVIESCTFYNVPFESITIPNGVTRIGDYAFSNCEKAETITLPDTLERIEDNAFISCKALKSIVIPKGITSIEEHTFWGCRSLESVTIPNSVRYIGTSAFGYCESLGSINLPDGVREIDAYAFQGCSMTSVTIPATVSKIHDYAFGYMESSFTPGKVACFAIFGTKYTEAEEYANKNGFKFIALSRLAGSNRYHTAAKISRASFEKADTVYLASSLNYADALAAVPLAADDSPILLTSKDLLADDTLSEIKRLEAKNVIILGGEGAISKTVENKLKAEGLNTSRIAGKNRFETATKIAEKVKDKPEDVFFVYGNGFADALSVSAVAAANGAPIIYLNTKGILDKATASYLASIKGSVKSAYVIGGEGVISNDMMKKAGAALGVTPTRIFGANRFDTCVAVNEKFADVLGGNTICVATGMDFPDALAGGVYAAKNKAPLFLINSKTKTATLSENQTAYLKAKAAGNIVAFGGTGAVSDEYIEEIAKCSK